LAYAPSPVYAQPGPRRPLFPTTQDANREGILPRSGGFFTVSLPGAHASRQSLPGRLAKVDDLLACQSQALRDCIVVQRQPVPELEKIIEAEIQDIGEFLQIRGSGLRKKHGCLRTAAVCHIEQQSQPLIQGQLADLMPETPEVCLLHQA